MKKSGFTFWQLLGVLAILFVIAAILFPVFATHESPPRRPTCTLNEKLLGLAIFQYVQDNDDQMPNITDVKDPRITWRNAIYPYTKTTHYFQCPIRDDKLNGPDGLPRSFAGNYTGNYSGHKNDKGNGAFAGAGSEPINIAEFPAPASLIMLCEVWRSDQPDFDIDNLGAFYPASDSLWAGHTDGGDYLFADGHVKYLKPLDTKTLWHRNASIPLSAGAINVLKHAHKDDLPQRM